ncbi:MAG: putative toxin-antitoxin system toxin component, PIN family [Candidatus Latescibacteria bacterium]|nr:putative toxin-antitoxin system toxin component, PIN family [Candidatus Latescibacterota bacterium]
MSTIKAVIDTNVLYAGLYSSLGASYQILRAIEQNKIRIVLSTTLVFEYEDVLKRDPEALDLTDQTIEALLDDLCSRSDHQAIYFLWRPCLSDPKDDHILELAVASETPLIITHNVKDFKKATAFGIQILTPSQLLKELK